MLMVRRMGMESTSGRTRAAMMGSGGRIRLMGMVCTCGLMGVSTRAAGSTTKCTGRDSTVGRTGAAITGSTSMIRSMDLECTPGLMAAGTLANGHIVNVMERGKSYLLMAVKGREFGRKTSALSGWIKSICPLIFLTALPSAPPKKIDPLQSYRQSHCLFLLTCLWPLLTYLMVFTKP